MLRNLFFLIFLAVLFDTQLASAAIPRGSFILKRVTEMTPKSAFEFEQSLSFPSKETTWTLKEHWLIENENFALVTLKGHPNNLTAAADQIIAQIKFHQNARTTAEGTQGWGQAFLDRFFWSRSIEGLSQFMITEKIAPAGFLSYKPVIDGKEFNYPEENFLRLSRCTPILCFQFASPEKLGSGASVWVDQDQFFVKHIRNQNMVEVIADKYDSFDQGIYFARVKNYKWEKNSVEGQLLSIKASKIKSLPQAALISNWNLLPPVEKEFVQEFYRKFRAF